LFFSPGCVCLCLCLCVVLFSCVVVAVAASQVGLTQAFASFLREVELLDATILGSTLTLTPHVITPPRSTPALAVVPTARARTTAT